MSQRILVRHLGHSSLAGQSAEFTEFPVKIGRREGNHIRFDPNRDQLVSGNHAELRLEGDKIVLHDLGSANGTFVNGQRITQPTPVTARDRISLGQNGPELLVSVMDSASAPMPTMVSTPAPTAAPGKTTPFDLSAPLPASTPPPPTPVTPELAGPRPVPGAHRPPSRASQGQPKTSIGMNTLMGVLSSERGKERKRILTLVIPIMLILIAPLAYFAYTAWIRENKTIIQSDSIDWKSLYSRVGESVYLVLIKTTKGPQTTYRRCGTAWSVAPGKLATNAHVADIWNEKEAGDEMIVRRVSQKGDEKQVIDLRIKSMMLHPGYMQHAEFSIQYRPFDPSSQNFESLYSPCDVGILEIHPDDVGKQGPPLPLASDIELKSISSGYPVAYVGYPVEGVGLDDESPASYQNNNEVNRVLDLFRGPTDPLKALFYGHGLHIVGGSSGSPMVNKNGEVVGLVCAGSFHFTPQGRIGIAGFNYAIPVQYAREVLDGKVEENQKVRGEEWRKLLLDRLRKGISNPDGILGWGFVNSVQMSKHPGFPGVLQKCKRLAREELELGADAKDIKLQLPEAGYYFFATVCDNPDAECVVQLLKPSGEVITTVNQLPMGENQTRLMYYGVDYITTNGPVTITMRVKTNKPSQEKSKLTYLVVWGPKE